MFHRFTRALFWVSFSLVLLSGAAIGRAEFAGGLDSLAGGAVEGGCVTCKDQSKTILECYYNIIAGGPCSPDACHDRTLNYFICEENKKKEVKDDCDVVKKAFVLELQVVYKSKNLKCDDKGWNVISGARGLPAKSKCVPYKDGEFKGNCPLEACDKGVMIGTNNKKGVTVCK